MVYLGAMCKGSIPVLLGWSIPGLLVSHFNKEILMLEKLKIAAIALVVLVCFVIPMMLVFLKMIGVL